MNRKEAEKAARERFFFHDFIKKKPDYALTRKVLKIVATLSLIYFVFRKMKAMSRLSWWKYVTRI